MRRLTIPAPIGGLNYRDGASSIRLPYALTLDNFICRPTYLETRKGVATYRTSPGSGSIVPGGAIRTIASHPNGKVVIGSPNNLSIFDTAINDYSDLPILGGLTTTTGLWNFTQHTGRVILCNGVDTPQVFNGTTMVPLAATGVTLSTLWAPQTFKGRTYYWQQNSRSFWYADEAGAFQGALAEYSLAQWVRGDGSLVALAPLTIDGGNGPDDFGAFLFSNGEVLLYQGDDPGNVNSWQQVGRFMIPPPLGPQCWAINGTATVVATKSGPVDLAAALQAGPMDRSSVVGDKITGSVAVVAPRAQLLFVGNERFMMQTKFDTASGGFDAETLCMDVDSKAWCRFTGSLGAAFNLGGLTCIGVISDALYLGGADGQLYRYGSPGIEYGRDYEPGPSYGGYGASALTAFDGLGAINQRKQITAHSVDIETPGGLTSSGIAFLSDRFGAVYNNDLSSVTFGPLSYGGADNINNENWRVSSGNGFTIAIAIFMGGGPIRWYATRLLMRVGGQR